MQEISVEEKITVESLNCEDPFLCKKSASQFTEMLFINNSGIGKAYYSIQSIPKRDFSKYNKEINVK